jgi:hypothetical protein
MVNRLVKRWTEFNWLSIRTGDENGRYLSFVHHLLFRNEHDLWETGLVSFSEGKVGRHLLRSVLLNELTSGQWLRSALSNGMLEEGLSLEHL